MTTENQAANVIGAGLSSGSVYAPQASSRSTQHYDLIMAAFVTVLLCASFMGPAKVADIGGIHFDAATLFFSAFLFVWRHSDRCLWLGSRPAHHRLDAGGRGH